MSGNPASVNAIATLPKTLDPRLRGDDADMWSFPRKWEPSGVRYAPATFPKTLDPRLGGDDASVSNRDPSCGRAALGRDQRHWIPACAGMTHPLPIAATLRVLLLDGCVTCCGLAATCRLGDR